MRYFVEMTDTFGGEANYSWVHRFCVNASSPLGAIRKVGRETGYSGRIRRDWDSGECARYNVRRAAICYFVQPWDDANNSYLNVKSL